MDCSNGLVDDCSDCLHGSRRGRFHLYRSNGFGERDICVRHDLKFDGDADRTITIIVNSHREGTPNYYPDRTFYGDGGSTRFGNE